MWIVRLALRRTDTFVVVAVLIAVLGAVSTARMSTDIFPNIDVPVVSFVPLALAVIFAMLASYFLSRTPVPTMVLYLPPKEAEARGDNEGTAGPRPTLWSFLRHPSTFHHAFNCYRPLAPAGDG